MFDSPAVPWLAVYGPWLIGGIAGLVAFFVTATIIYRRGYGRSVDAAGERRWISSSQSTGCEAHRCKISTSMMLAWRI
jgi:hypothetical protein